MSLPWPMAALGTALLGLAVAQGPLAYNSATTPNVFDELTSDQLKAESAVLLKQAQASPSGMASETLQKYPGHFTMLTVRLKSGGAEQHDHADDIFVVLSGEATERIGGTIANSKVSAPGEIRGSEVSGGTEHVMRAGDVVHISPGTPHQTMVAPGQVFTYFVIKVQQ